MTTPPLHLGKKWGMRRMATPRGHFTMVALDQRPPIAQLIGARRGIAPADVSFADMVAVKRTLVDTLGAHASAMLFDPNYAFPAALQKLPAHTGLVVTLEDHRFRDTPGGRLSHSIDDWSVEKIKRAGGDGVKVLAWYRPDAEPDVLAHQKHYVEAIGAECRQHDIPYVFELLVYPFPKSAAHTGLVVTLEDHRFKDTPGGRLSHSIQDWSVEKIKRAGGDGVKVLAWYRPDASPDVLAHQKRYVEEIGRECRRHDIPYVLELLVYPFPKSASHTTDYVESPEKRPELVLESVREFAHPRYGVDLFKLEAPLAGATLSERDGGPAHLAAQGWFDAMGRVCTDAGIPWVMLSAGVTPMQFLRVMEYAYAAGAHGFLAGRAVWWQALQRFPDMDGFAEQLRREGVATLRDLQDLTRRAAAAWEPDYSGFRALKAEGELCAAYA